jgi:hypothetical protein
MEAFIMGQCILPKDNNEKKPQKEPALLSTLDKAQILAKKVREAPVLDLYSSTLLRRRGISKCTIATKDSEEEGLRVDV